MLVYWLHWYVEHTTLLRKCGPIHWILQYLKYHLNLVITYLWQRYVIEAGYHTNEHILQQTSVHRTENASLISHKITDCPLLDIKCNHTSLHIWCHICWYRYICHRPISANTFVRLLFKKHTGHRPSDCCGMISHHREHVGYHPHTTQTAVKSDEDRWYFPCKSTNAGWLIILWPK